MAKSNDHVDQHRLFTSSVPQMPEGYYSGDKPNPNLRVFVEEHVRNNPYDPVTDMYDVPVFDTSIESTKATPLYNMHTYWSKKPHDAIRTYIKHYTKPGDIILDPFAGSGGTALSANLEGRDVIAIDLDPSATHIIAGSVLAYDADEIGQEITKVLKLTSDIEYKLYKTDCAKCHGEARITSVTWSERFQCDKCLRILPLWGLKSSGVMKGKSELKICPHCNNHIYAGSERHGYIPVQFYIECQDGCKPKSFCIEIGDKEFDKYAKQNDIVQSLSFDYWYPNAEFPDGLETVKRKRFKQIGFKTIDTIFTKRNMHALSGLWDAINKLESRNILKFIFTSFVLNTSKLYRFREDGGGQPTGNYYVPAINRELNVFDAFRRKCKDIVNAKSFYLSEIKTCNVIVSTQSSLDLSNIPSNSIDYIFTDPPYGDTYQYRELNAVWNGWLVNDASPHPEDMVVNEYQNKDIVVWAELFRKAFSECSRVLKPGRCLSLCFHHTSSGVWEVVQDIMAECGFVVEQATTTTSIGTGQRSYYQRVLDNTVKRDLVINYRKPYIDEAKNIFIYESDNNSTFIEKVIQIIRNYLSINPGGSKDKIYDEVVSHMVRAGKMEAHNFDELLKQVADATEGTDGSRWYLKDSSLDIIDAAESAKEDAAAEKISTFIAGYLAKHPTAEGVHYSDIFEQFVYSVKDKPRRPLAEWLLDYFFKTDDGTYRLPISEEENRLKSEGRSKGTQRRIKRYIAFLQQGVAIPDKERPNDSTLAEWVRHCKRSGLYEQGKLLYEKGGLNLDNLPEEAMVNVEEDYQVCVRLLARGGGAAADVKPKRGRKAKA